MAAIHEKQVERAEVNAAFRKLNDDQKRAYCEGDLDLDDILAVEMNDRQRAILVDLLLVWGRKVGVIDD